MWLNLFQLGLQVLTVLWWSYQWSYCYGNLNNPTPPPPLTLPAAPYLRGSKQAKHTHPRVYLAEVAISLEDPAEERLVVQIYLWDAICPPRSTVPHPSPLTLPATPYPSGTKHAKHTHPRVYLAEIAISLEDPAEERLVVQIYLRNAICPSKSTVHGGCPGQIRTRRCLGNELHHITMWNITQADKKNITIKLNTRRVYQGKLSMPNEKIKKNL